MTKTFLSIIIIITLLASCNLFKKTIEAPAEAETVCDENTSYVQNVKAIFDNRCIGCHSGERPAYGISLTSYETASKVAGHRLKCVISWSLNCNKMPPKGAQLSADEIKLINCWIDNGLKP